jgi:uncharacterized protein YyaL (SSP411 family)
MPGFPRVLDAVSKAWRERPGDVDRSVQELLERIEGLEAPAPTPGELDSAMPGKAAAALLRHVDLQHGGLGGAPKFPHTSAPALPAPVTGDGKPESPRRSASRAKMATGGM